MKTDSVFWQTHGNGHGNFIQCTPALQAIAHVWNRPVPAYFDNPACADLVREAPFLRIIDWPPRKDRVLFTTADINQKIPDCRYLFEKHARGRFGCDGSMPHTYVDRVDLSRLTPQISLTEVGGYCVIVRGAVNAKWHARKDPGDAIYRRIIGTLLSRGIPVVLVGGPNDRQWWMNRMATWNTQIRNLAGDNTRRALAILNGARLVVANDTGLYHAAGALDKMMLVLWKDTNLEKNRSPGHHITYSHYPHWWRDFVRWLNKVI